MARGFEDEGGGLVDGDGGLVDGVGALVDAIGGLEEAILAKFLRSSSPPAQRQRARRYHSPLPLSLAGPRGPARGHGHQFQACPRRPPALFTHGSGELARPAARSHTRMFMLPGANSPPLARTRRVPLAGPAARTTYASRRRASARRDLAATTAREGRALSRFCDYVPQLAKLTEPPEGRPASPRQVAGGG